MSLVHDTQAQVNSFLERLANVNPTGETLSVLTSKSPQRESERAQAHASGNRTGSVRLSDRTGKTASAGQPRPQKRA